MKKEQSNNQITPFESTIKDTKIPTVNQVISAVKQLKSLHLAAQRIKFPHMPEFARCTPSFSDETANGLTKCIIAWISLMGGQAERISTMGRPIEHRQIYSDVVGRTRVINNIEWIPGNGTLGSADISATIKGRSVKIEVKIGRDIQSQAQKNYQTAIERSGGIYYIARDFTSFIEWYNSNFGGLNNE